MLVTAKCQMEQLCRLAYFEELRQEGETTQAEVARIFGRSRRSVIMRRLGSEDSKCAR